MQRLQLREYMMIKNKAITIGICMVMMAGLCGCAGSESRSAGSGSSGGQNTSSGTVSGQNAAGDAGSMDGIGNDGAASLPADGAGAGAAEGQDGSMDGIGNDGAPSLGYAEGDGAAEVSPEDTYDAMNQSGDAYQMAEAGEEGWDGSFASGEGETLTVSQIDDQTISFSFAVSGISGSASIDGDEAYYNGDDGTTVVFENAGGSMEVSVTDSEGQSISATISGSFMRQ